MQDCGCYTRNNPSLDSMLEFQWATLKGHCHGDFYVLKWKCTEIWNQMPFLLYRILKRQKRKEIKWFSRSKNKPWSLSGDISTKQRKNLKTSGWCFQVATHFHFTINPTIPSHFCTNLPDYMDSFKIVLWTPSLMETDLVKRPVKLNRVLWTTISSHIECSF